jgi:uncharacterized YigZ family protein
LKFVQKQFNTTLEVKKSKFITYICPYSDFKELITKLKIEHPKARHFIYAYRYLNEFNQIVENSSDDGEPKGTSGRPSLNVLNGANIINTAIVTIRYFGGIKLGTGGLVKAYSDTVNLVCTNSEFKIYENLEQKTLEIEYTNLSKIQYQLKTLGINIVKQEFETKVLLTLEATKEKFSKLLSIKEL